MPQNIGCFIVYIVIIMLGSFRKQGIVFHFSFANMRLERLNNLPFNVVKLNFVSIFVFFVTTASFIEIIFF